jgi:hypothetical protein
MYLIPFYDLYKLKEDLEERYRWKCDKLKKSPVLEGYTYILKKLR